MQMHLMQELNGSGRCIRNEIDENKREGMKIVNLIVMKCCHWEWAQEFLLLTNKDLLTLWKGLICLIFIDPNGMPPL